MLRVVTKLPEYSSVFTRVARKSTSSISEEELKATSISACKKRPTATRWRSLRHYHTTFLPSIM